MYLLIISLILWKEKEVREENADENNLAQVGVGS